MSSADPAKVSTICRPGDSGLLLPLFSSEQTWPDPLRAVLYCFAMLYCFLGVSMVADTFVEAIDVITTHKRRIRSRSGEYHLVTSWNEVVANLSLMALGSSAPEIFLSVIDLFRQDMHAGDLGGATIVGSAAFNLQVIVAVCIGCLPPGEVRSIESLQVYYATAAFSIWAYAWLIIVLGVHTPDVIDLWEALATLLMLPVLIWVSYRVDIGLLDRFFSKDSEPEKEVAEPIPEALPDESIETAASASRGTPSSARMPNLHAHKSNILCKYTGSRVRFQTSQLWDSAMEHMSYGSSLQLTTSESISNSGVNQMAALRVQLLAPEQSMSQRLMSKPIVVVRTGGENIPITVEYTVHSCEELVEPESDQKLDGEAENLNSSGQVPQRSSRSDRPKRPILSTGIFHMNIGDMESMVSIVRPLSNDGLPQDFYFRLSKVKCPGKDVRSGVWGGITESKVSTAIDCPGYLSWLEPSMTVVAPEAGSEKKRIFPTVVRRAGCVGSMACAWRTQALTAVGGYDFVEAHGVLRFTEGVTEQMMDLQICPKRPGRTPDQFLVILEPLSDVPYPVNFDEHAEGAPESCILCITVEPTMAGTKLQRRLDRWLNLEHIRKGNSEWVEKMGEAWWCNGSRAEQSESSWEDFGFHLFALPWKILFILVPPSSYTGGWFCFIICLFFIGIITAALADLSELFGCVCGLPDFVTAICLVALGTSMPDLFASKSAAIGDPTADASIINVTGSNSVNVFLGLGLPWTIGSIYWSLNGRTPEWEEMYPEVAARYDKNVAVFVLEAGDLAFGVALFSAASAISIFILFLRRAFLGAELGGPSKPKVASVTAFVSLWFAYVILASWRSIRDDRSDTVETLSIVLPMAIICCGTVSWAIWCIVTHRRNPGDPEEEMHGEQSAADRAAAMVPVYSGTLAPVAEELNEASPETEAPTSPREPEESEVEGFLELPDDTLKPFVPELTIGIIQTALTPIHEPTPSFI
mmetsp:Transcript_15484/g.33557  ORF Transcript_15484/g.33557 Transcript_15484/m.33557 type:complete len:980 (-) Transcript_15484:62-3001(-)|eukprot:CAMPEP_0206433904 /NCGR_PEP_ID=MMETSP0324_2-20121206/8800_1 /ASSEMBLY_ACC=CAM_ASM_000836 /TAXON_ID=2866 /ORGANISM="Crypthecodinium cohnii, Strain Seligo" /LENGTH=979 /DNA_ID=CAMNT_0053900237 /DNA_START=216 /DNA_END=3155 /DNA_ORIENTATION=+